MILKNGLIVLEDKVIKTGLKIENGKIIDIDDFTEGLDMEGFFIVPGFIDQHIHGSFDADAMDGTDESLVKIATSILREGTTSFLATTMTEDPDKITKALEVSKNYKGNLGANLVGVHLEGPFINPGAIGAQPLKYVQKPNLELFKKWAELDVIKVITMAPEIEGADELIKYCVEKNIVVSIGHTKANYNQVKHAMSLGAKQGTHTYNAMTPLHHRDIGVVGALYLEDELLGELICDGIHSSKEAVKLLYKNKGREGIILISDSMRAKYLEEGLSTLGGQDVYIKNGEARLKDGTLAGSILKMNDAVMNMMEFCDISIIDAVYMASSMPALNLGLKNKGFIKLGYDADLTVLDKNGEVVMTIVNGTIKYERDGK